MVDSTKTKTYSTINECFDTIIDLEYKIDNYSFDIVKPKIGD